MAARSKGPHPPRKPRNHASTRLKTPKRRPKTDAPKGPNPGDGDLLLGDQCQGIDKGLGGSRGSEIKGHRLPNQTNPANQQDACVP